MKWCWCYRVLLVYLASGHGFSFVHNKNVQSNRNSKPGVPSPVVLSSSPPWTSYAHTSAAEANVRIDSVPHAPEKGLGAFATRSLHGGAWVGEYHGEMLTRTEVEARYWKQGRSGDYLFDVGDDMFIDGENMDVSGWCRFLNHADDGTEECNVDTRCTWQIWDGEKIVQPRLWFVAARDIEPGEELCFDYGDSYW